MPLMVSGNTTDACATMDCEYTDKVSYLSVWRMNCLFSALVDLSELLDKKHMVDYM